ncbi:hypothetical protein QZM28_10520, partial [Burkholderia multivorans]|nr:hypothetical protein [Burkholderia multivorans]
QCPKFVINDWLTHLLGPSVTMAKVNRMLKKLTALGLFLKPSLSWQSGFERVKKPESGVGGAEKEFLRPLEFWVTAVTNIPTLRRHCPDAAAALAALAFFAA